MVCRVYSGPKIILVKDYSVFFLLYMFMITIIELVTINEPEKKNHFLADKDNISCQVIKHLTVTSVIMNSSFKKWAMVSHRILLPPGLPVTDWEQLLEIFDIGSWHWPNFILS